MNYRDRYHRGREARHFFWGSAKPSLASVVSISLVDLCNNALFRLLLFVFLCAASLSLPAGLKRWTHSFHLSRCMPPASSAWEGGKLFSSLPAKEIGEVLSQTFYYLDRGAQSFVFASQDGRYVLKLFLFDPSPFKAKKMLESCKIAAQAVEETALVYLHFGPSKETLPVVRLVGPAWRRTRLQCANYCFALQMRAVPFKESLFLAYREKNLDALTQRLDAFYSLLRRRISMGILNSDPGLCCNFGFIEDSRAIEIDFGNYSLEEKCDEDREMNRYRRKLVEWASIEMPEWKEEFEKR